MNAAKKAISIQEFCDAYGVGRTFAYKLIGEKKLQIAKAGRRSLVLVESAEKWLQESLKDRGI